MDVKKAISSVLDRKPLKDIMLKTLGEEKINNILSRKINWGNVVIVYDHWTFSYLTRMLKSFRMQIKKGFFYLDEKYSEYPLLFWLVSLTISFISLLLSILKKKGKKRYIVITCGNQL